MSTFTPIAGAYSNHIGGGWTHPVTGAVYFLVTFRANSAGPYRLQVWEDKAPYGKPKMIREWVTGTDEAGPGPWGYATCTWLPNGSLYVIAPGGVVSGSAVQPSWHIEPNLFPPIAPSDVEARLTAIETALGTIAAGYLDNADREALNRVKHLIWG